MAGADAIAVAGPADSGLAPHSERQQVGQARVDSQGGARSPARAVPRIRLEGLRGALLWLTGFAGAFVFMEPSPYEFASLLTIVFFAAAGLALRPALMPLVFLLTLYNIGFSIAVIPVLDQSIARTWVLVSWYLSATALFFAAMLGSNTQQR